MRITQDTTWSGTVTLDDDVVVAKGVTLTVAPGTVIVGNGHELQVRGALDAAGTTRGTILFQDVNLTGNAGTGSRPGTIDLLHTEHRGGTVLAAREDRATVHADASIQKSVFIGLDAAVNARFVENLVIEGNVFLDSPGILLATAEPFTLRNNIFEDQVTDGTDTYAFGPYQTYYDLKVESRGNAYLSGDKIAIDAFGPGVRSVGDYFGGNPEDMILDRNDDPDKGRLNLVNPKTEADFALLNALDRPLFVHDDFDQPSQFIFRVTLVGDRDADLGGSDNVSILTGNAGDNMIRGRGGDDVLSGRGGDDILFGGSGSDDAQGGRGADILLGNAGNDRLYGDGGNDLLRGDKGIDLLMGGRGDDILFGGAGADDLYGGTGNDLFIQRPRLDGDTINDFEQGADTIGISTPGVGFDDLVITERDGDAIVRIDGQPGAFTVLDMGGKLVATDFMFEA